MQVASLELCKTLHELSGWDARGEDELDVYLLGTGNLVSSNNEHPDAICPAYDLGYLLRKLPGVKLEQIDKDYWNAQQSYNDGTELPDYKTCDAGTPEDAAAKLCVALLKQGVLTK